MSDVDLSKLDPGIRTVVERLRACGFETTDSGDGRTKPAELRTFQEPHVFMRVEPDAMVLESKRLLALFPHAHVEATYSPIDDVAMLLLLGAIEEEGA